METTKTTQAQKVLDYIRQFGSITQLDAIRDLGVMRLAARVSDLKRQGYCIISEQDTVMNRFGEPCYVARYSERRDIQ